MLCATASSSPSAQAHRADGPVTATYDATANLGVGTYAITATADGRDNAGSDTVTADVTKQVLQLIVGQEAGPAVGLGQLVHLL